MLRLKLRESFNITHILQYIIFSRRDLHFKKQTMLGYKVPMPNEHWIHTAARYRYSSHRSSVQCTTGQVQLPQKQLPAFFKREQHHFPTVLFQHSSRCSLGWMPAPPADTLSVWELQHCCHAEDAVCISEKCLKSPSEKPTSKNHMMTLVLSDLPLSQQCLTEG